MKDFFKIGLMSIVISLSFGFSGNSSLESDEWTFIAEQSGIKAFVKVANCGSSDSYIFKLENTLATESKLKCIIGVVNSQAFGPQTHIVELNSKETLTGVCGEKATLTLPKSSHAKGNLKDQVTIKLIINQ